MTSNWQTVVSTYLMTLPYMVPRSSYLPLQEVKKKISLQEFECSKKIAKVRIHVERVIGLLKNKYTILQGTLPVTFLKRKNDIDTAFMDKVLIVCSALVNLSPIYC